MSLPRPLAPVPNLEALLADPERAASLPPETRAALARQVADLLARLAGDLRPEAAGELAPEVAALHSALLVRVMSQNGGPSPGPVPDRRLTLAEAAKVLHCSVDWVYRRTKGPNALPFLIREGRSLFVSEQALQKYLRRSLPRGAA